jgi:hypothetical protein
MLHFDPEHHDNTIWAVDERAECATIARSFLAGESGVLQLIGGRHDLVSRIEEFLRVSESAPLSIARSATGHILIRAGITSAPLLLTGRTADVLGRYLDGEPVRMSDRSEMTQRIRTTSL